MPFSDQTLKCKDCGADFVWTEGEQEFYAQKGFANAPTRCPTCRQSRREQNMSQRQPHKITCAKCGKEDEVPFKPTEGREVLCSACFQAKREAEKMGTAPETTVMEAPPQPVEEVKTEKPPKK